MYLKCFKFRKNLKMSIFTITVTKANFITQKDIFFSFCT